MDRTTGPGKINFGYNRFADLFYYIMAHIPLDCAADVYDAEFAARMAGDLGVSPLIPQRLGDYFREHFDRLMIVCFLPLMTDNTRHFRDALASCGALTEQDMESFADPLVGICDRVSDPFYRWWEQHHNEMAPRKEAVFSRLGALAARFAPFLDSVAPNMKILLSYTLRRNGRAFTGPDGLTVFLSFPEKDGDLPGCFLQFLHECTHSVTDPLLNRGIRMADGSHMVSEYQVICFDDFLVEALAPDLLETYRNWVGPELLGRARQELGTEGERRLKDCLAGFPL